MDKKIRRHEICVIGQPRCDFVFSSTRSCFIAYGFEESTLEMTIMRKLLEERSIQPEEAGGLLCPAQNAFCAKICSKIITSQFCIVLLNNDNLDGRETPNANINMEYGLMLGFNKYIIPFQRTSQKLPFNVAGLDTVKYTDRDFEKRAIDAIDQAIATTRQDETPTELSDQLLQMFILSRDLLMTVPDNQGEKDISRLGQPVGFLLLNDFTGLKYIFLGLFSSLRPESVVWRIRKLNQILKGRQSSIGPKVAMGSATAQQAVAAILLFKAFQILVIVTSEQDKSAVEADLAAAPLDFKVELVTINSIRQVLGANV